MPATLIADEVKQLERTQGGSIIYWIGGLMNIMVQTCYDLQYITM